MAEQISEETLPLGVWHKRLPKKIGTVTIVRNFFDDNVLTKFEFEIVVIFPVTFIIDIRHREFYEGAEVPEHRDAFEPIYGCSVNLLLQRAKAGGEFRCEKTIFKSDRLCIFNGTRYLHSVSRVEEGTRKSLIGSLQFAFRPAPMVRRRLATKP
ncbi:hypothetical protein [Variovorax sp. J22R115]|uniref:hypothetical protein n=1 Tax=Variovorax sp. J22R115 TaxID=3053509 RepID=UPI002576203E|nr:hypothetical protein [Variovorax sp. J22R115]MDM0053003.1 hypothetical protein [Variovorax sp. J22R115]